MKKSQQGRGKEVSQVCAECGISANVVTCLKKYGQSPKKLAFTLSTSHKGKCDFCGEEKHITQVRDFFYPNFKLLKQVVFALHGLTLPKKNNHKKK